MGRLFVGSLLVAVLIFLGYMILSPILGEDVANWQSSIDSTFKQGVSSLPVKEQLHQVKAAKPHAKAKVRKINSKTKKKKYRKPAKRKSRAKIVIPAQSSLREKAAEKQNTAVKNARRSRWVKELSGANVELHRLPKAEETIDCRYEACPERVSSYSLVGVVVNTDRKDSGILDGELASGDSQKTPLLYLK